MVREHGCSWFSWCGLPLIAALSVSAAPAAAQVSSPARTTGAPVARDTFSVPDIRTIVPAARDREGVSATLQILILLTVLSLAPAILIMMTSFTRIIIVLALLRQALAVQQLPPSQILTGLALFLTLLIICFLKYPHL